MTIRRLAELLRRLGLDAAEEELLDILWLARYLDEPARSDNKATNLKEDASGNSQPKSSAESVLKPPEARGVGSSHDTVTATYYLHARQKAHANATGGRRAVAVRAPATSALTEQLRLARALRPLTRKVPSRYRWELDEEATANRIADEELWIPALRPAPARWLEIALVVDGYESMSIWRHAIAELKALLESLGAFRDVRFWKLEQAEHDPTQIGVRRPRPGSALRSPRELIDPSGRRAIVIVSDCLGPAWQSGVVQRVLAFWGRRGPVAIIQPLPQRLWSYSHARPTRARLHALQPGVPNSLLFYALPKDSRIRRPDGSVPVPVLELEPVWVASWSRLLTASGVSGVDAMLLFASEDEIPEVAEEFSTDVQRLTPTERLQRFRGTASPGAVHLAEYLSAAPISLPVIRVVQEVMLGSRSQSQIAEVFLGGLLYKLDATAAADPDEEQYDFLPGIRELLGRRLRRGDALRTLHAVSKYVGDRFGQARDFRALLSGADVEGEFAISPGSRPFAEVAERVLRSLGDSYTSSAQVLARALAPGIETLVGFRPPDPPPPSETVASWARGTAGDPGAIRVGEAFEAQFKAALSQVSLGEERNRNQPLVCPYCYQAFAERSILFRCSGQVGRDGKRCLPGVDDVLRASMGESALLPPVVISGARKDEAICSRCDMPTRIQVCPSCHSRLPASFRTVRSRLIALVGPGQAGKTAFMTVLIHELRHRAGEHLMSSTIGADETTQERFSRYYEWPMYTQSQLLGPTKQKFITPLVFRFTLTQRARIRPNREILLSFADSAGEDLVSLPKVELMARYLSAADAVIVLIDPLQFQEVRDRINPGTPVPSKASREEEPVRVFDRITSLLLFETREGRVVKPTAVVLSKIDVLWQLLPPGNPLRVERPMSSRFDQADSALLQDSIVELLNSWGASGLHQIAQTNYSRFRYFAISALGVTPTRDNAIPEPGIQPYRVTEPFLWLLNELNILRQS
jgi:GTPase SAR1 family protein